MSELLTIEAVLEDLQRQGWQESSGKFTIDPNKALPQLQKFRLPDPYSYVLKFLQAAVVGGASAFHLQSSTRRVRVQMPGLQVPSEGLHNIFSQLLDETRLVRNASLEHLAVGLHGALGTRASEIAVNYWDGEQGVQLVWTVSGQEFSRWDYQGPPLCFIELTRVREDVWKEVWEKLSSRHVQDMLWGGEHGWDREQRIVREGGDVAPLEVTINGRLLMPGSVNLKVYTSGFFLPTKNFYVRERCLPKVGGTGFRLTDQPQAKISEGRCEAAVYGGFVAHPRVKFGANRILVVRDGAVVRRCTFKEEGREFVAIVDGPQLTMDLTSMQFVEDEHWQELFRNVCEMAGQMAGD